MENQKRLAQIADACGEVLLGDIVEERASDAERPARKRDFDFAVVLDVFDVLLRADDMPDRKAPRSSPRFRHLACHGEHGRRAVANQDRRRAAGRRSSPAAATGRRRWRRTCWRRTRPRSSKAR
jgi:hypothetical protein